MAHSDDTRRAVRAAYVFDQVALGVAAHKHDVPEATAKRWVREARAAGDDWDKARGAQMIAGGGIEAVVRQTLGVAVRQVQATIEAIDSDPDMPPAEKAKTLASLADSYNKLLAASRRMMPETDKLAVAMGVLQDLAEFIRTQHPRHMAAFAEILEAFGARMAK